MIEKLVKERAEAAGLRLRRTAGDGRPAIAPRFSGSTIWRGQHTGERGLYEALAFVVGYGAGVASERS